MLDQRVAVYRSAGSAGVHVDGAEPGVSVQHRARALGQTAGRPVSPVQQHAVPHAVAGVPGHAAAVAVARTPLPAHSVPAAQTTSLGTVLRGRVGHHVVVSSKVPEAKRFFFFLFFLLFRKVCRFARVCVFGDYLETIAVVLDGKPAISLLPSGQN